jgi:hypothetical protein
MVGDRPVNLVGFQDKFQYTPMCTPEGLTPMFCSNGTQKAKCDLYFEQVSTILDSTLNFNTFQIIRNRVQDIGEQRALPGFASGVWSDNLWRKYRTAGDVLTKGNHEEEPEADANSFWIFEDTTTSFMVLIGVYFPSVTGIMAGSNRSGNLRDSSRAIPFGTIAAQMSTSLTCKSFHTRSK